jgi:NADH dehydrogenase [ubiquinone] 1 alpha subcomplex assembly factor 7
VNALAERLVRLIEAQGPISVAQFMMLALHDPVHGYYATRDPIGARGDFITAPEVSQMFGELLGLCCVQAWRDQRCPSPARLVELGPGRGTLMADALRAARLDPDFLASIEVVLIETSARLRDVQALKLDGRDETVTPPIRWSNAFDDSFADRPLFLLANEFFDALPIRQFVFTDHGWCERTVGTADGKLTFGLAPAAGPLDIPPERGAPRAGDIYEVSPSGEAIVEQIASVIAKQGGAALIVDYGYGAGCGFRETLQGVAEHKFASLLENPGEADLSAHVDFAALARAAERAGAKTYGPIAQGTFLKHLGIEERSRRLTRANREQERDIAAAAERLTSADQMGTLFRALAILPARAPAPGGF